jgi:hypothetical protein
MAATLITAQTDTLTDNAADNSKRVKVKSGSLALAYNYVKASSTNLSIVVNYSFLDDPDVTNADHWWLSTGSVGGPVGSPIVITNAGRFIMDLNNRFPGVNAGDTVLSGVPAGVKWIRVRVALTGTTTGASAEVYLLHDVPYPAPGTGAVNE